MSEWLEVFTIIAGTFASMAAFTMSAYFARTRNVIGQAVAIDKFAEGINMLVILAFAIVYYFDFFEVMPLYQAAALRIAAIGATTFSSIHLAIRTKQVIETEPKE